MGCLCITLSYHMVLYDDLERWDRGGEAGSKGRGYMYIIMTNTSFFIGGTNTTV